MEEIQKRNPSMTSPASLASTSRLSDSTQFESSFNSTFNPDEISIEESEEEEQEKAEAEVASEKEVSTGNDSSNSSLSLAAKLSAIQPKTDTSLQNSSVSETEHSAEQTTDSCKQQVDETSVSTVSAHALTESAVEPGLERKRSSTEEDEAQPTGQTAASESLEKATAAGDAAPKPRKFIRRNRNIYEQESTEDG